MLGVIDIRSHSFVTSLWLTAPFVSRSVVLQGEAMEATLDLVRGGAAWSNTLDDLIVERVVYLQLVGTITEMQGMPRNGTNIAIMHILDTTKMKGQKCQNTGTLGTERGRANQKAHHHCRFAAGYSERSNVALTKRNGNRPIAWTNTGRWAAQECCEHE